MASQNSLHPYSNAVIDYLLDVMNYDLISVEQLAAASGIDLSYLEAAFEKFTPLSLWDVEKISDALGLRVDELLGEVRF